MTPSQWEHLKSLFEAAIELGPGDRAQFIEQTCGNDAALLAELERLIDEHQRAGGSFLEAPALGLDKVPTEGRQPHAFSPDQVVAGRFRILRFIGEGGMGEVYEARDLELSERVALKTVRSQLASDDRTMARFRQEIQLARKVTHPNVCRIFDVHRHEQITFLTMELLEGETLADRLRRKGRMETAEAQPVVTQMADGLEAAHRAGIIHRDFKSGNVMLVPSGGSGTRAVVTDFGLARSIEPDDTERVTASAGGRIIGTPAYMAPEQFEGGPITPATDIYALGVVLYEMVAGERPFSGRSPLAAAFQRVRQHPPAPRVLVPNLDPNWDAAITRCLARDPAERFQKATEVVGAIEGKTDSAPSPEPAPKTGALPRRRLVAAFGVAVALFLAAWFGWSRLYSILHPLPQRRFVALMAFPPGQTAADVALLNNVVDGMDARLVRSESYVKDLLIIGPEDLAAQQKKLNKPEDAITALGANLVLTTSVVGSTQALRLELLDPASRHVLRRASFRVNRAEIARIPEQAATVAAELLGLAETPQQWKDRDELAGLTPAAYQLFVAAEELRKQPNDTGLDQAIERYQQALDADPHFALGYAKIALAYVRKYQLGHDRAALTVADKNAQLAIEHDPDSPKAVLSQALVYLYSGRTTQAVDSLTRALRLDPGNPEVLIYKAIAYRYLNRPRDEENTYRLIVKQRPNFYLAYNELGLLLYRQGRYGESAAVLQEAAQVAPRLALPLTNLGTAYLLLGRKQDAIAAFRASLERGPSELAYLNLGNISFEEGDFGKALDSYRKARDLKPSDDLTWRNIADCYSVLGDHKGMLENYANAARVLSEHLKINPNNGPGWMNLAFYEAKLGHRAEAESDLNTGESKSAADVESQFIKAQTLAVLGRQSEAISVLVSCVRRGLSPVEVRLALDLKEIRSDRRYLRQVSTLKQETANANVDSEKERSR